MLDVHIILILAATSLQFQYLREVTNNDFFNQIEEDAVSIMKIIKKYSLEHFF